jgi:peptide-methionine (S)-S-oxide reductase
VQKVTAGYAGGGNQPSYEQVSTGDSGFAEAVQIEYDAREISFHDLLKAFFIIHDPTQLNRQGNDVGTQYRSAIFYHDEEQKQAAEQLKQELDTSGEFGSTIVTTIESLENFYSAEDYHQQYFQKNPSQPYCQVVIAPKLQKFREKFAAKLKPSS